MYKLNGVKNIALLLGGTSSEREISLKTGNNVGSLLEDIGYTVTYIDTKDSNFINSLIDCQPDVVFIALHGKGGEDGKIQGLLETLKIPYTGSGVCSSSIAINKALTKLLYINYKRPLPTSDFVVVDNMQYDIDKITAKIGENVVVKAASQGSSVGLFICNEKREIKEALDKTLKLDKYVVVEKYIEGREFTVPTMIVNKEEKQSFNDNLKNYVDNVCSFPVIEIVPKNKFYDFESKYAQGGSKHICPAKISSELTKKLQILAADAHLCLSCKGIVRTDFIVDKNNNVFLLETNTLPGMTATSLVPESAKIAGLEFWQLCNLILKDALASSHK